MQLHKPSISKYLLILPIVVCVFTLITGFKNPKKLVYNNAAPTTHTVTIFKMKYTPAHLNVKKGDTVVWINKDFFPHDVTEETTHEWTSKPFNQGEKWSKVVTKDIKYFCNLHKIMKGSINITN